jgi:transmembrane sensor
MNVSEELLDKYFKNKCTPEEKLLVARYLLEIDELPAQLSKKEEWDNAQDFSLTADKSEELFDRIRKQTFAKKAPFKWLNATSIAATFLVLISVGLIFFKIKPALHQNVEKNIPKVAEINWKSTVNYTNRIQEITLPDQSKIKIYPGGEIRYALPFIKAKREIFMNGKSYFQVTKDKDHPFVVYAKGVSTTALGTSFTITANNNSKLIQVKLHTGKVWVKHMGSFKNQSLFSKILLPGNELVFNQITQNVKVVLPPKVIAENEMKTELNFSQTPLSEVFIILEAHYKTKIIYKPEDLKEISFTGSLNLKHTLNQILAEITELNQLIKEQTPNGYLIRK